MPLFRYFLSVGGTLLALLFVADAAVPTVPLPQNLTSGSDLPLIRIHSDRKLPERVVFDTSVVLPAPAVARAPVESAIAEIPAKARVREAFAQLPQQDTFEPKMTDMATVVVPRPKTYRVRQPLRPKVAAKPRNARPLMFAARQPRFGGVATW